MRAFILLRYFHLKHAYKGLLFFLCLLLGLSFVFQIVFIDNSQLKSVPIALVDEDQSPTSGRVVASILEKSILHTEILNADASFSRLKNHKVEAIVTIKSGFEAALSKGHYDKLIVLTYLDRSTSAPALTDVLAGSVLKEACTYNAILQVQRYDKSEGALQEITEKVKTSIQSQEYHVPLELEIKAPTFIDQTVSNIPFESQLPKRLAVGYTLFVALLITSLFAVQLGQELTNTVSRRIQASVHSLMSYTIVSMLIAISFFVLIFGAMTGYFIGYQFLIESGGVVSLLIHLAMTLTTWMILILILSLLFKSRSGFYTLMLPLVVLTGLVSGCFWPLDFISRSVMKPISFLPSYEFILTLENILIGQPTTTVQITKALSILVVTFIALIVTMAVTTLKKNRLK